MEILLGFEIEKMESLVPLLVGFTVKSIQENEVDNQLVIKTTLTLKLPIRKEFSQSKKFLEKFKEDARNLLTSIGLNINKDQNQFLVARNVKLNKNKQGDYTDFSISDHFVANIDRDRCKFTQRLLPFQCCGIQYNTIQYNTIYQSN